MNPSDLLRVPYERHGNLPEARQQTRHNRRMELVGRLTAMVLHEMRNPLSVIKGYAEMIARGEGTKEDPHVGGLLKGVERLDAVMNCVLSLVRTPTNDGSATNVAASVRLVQEFVTMAHRPKPEVIVEVPEELPHARIGSTDLEQVLLNLLVNACDASNPHPAATVRASFASDGPPVPAWGPYMASTTGKTEWPLRWPIGKPAILISVCDAGCGIAPNVLRLLFNEQITTKQNRDGTGLGLLLCREVVFHRSASLVIESSFGEGTTATTILPVATPEPWTEDASTRHPPLFSAPD